VADRWFFWVRASMLETRRVANWWTDCMVATNRPLQEKLALFWRGHFASSEEKVRDYRKMFGQVLLFQRNAAGNFGALLSAVTRDPAMLIFLDAGQNVKGCPNENFGREPMELFTMGVGHYSEQDIREAARAFMGWRDRDLSFHIDEAQHDAGEKTVLGRTGPFDGQEVVDITLARPPQRVSPPANSIASSCATICHHRFRTGWAICYGRTITRSRRSCGRCFYRATSTVRPRSARISKGRSN
jgi:uncharacterized protein (DUF1800 family)